MTKQAIHEAHRLGHSWVGPEHILLAVLAAPSAVSKALGELGVTHEKVAALLAARRHHPPASQLPPGEEPRLNPAFYRAMGWASGFSASAGLQKPESGDWLLATLYRQTDGDEAILALINDMGAPAETVVDALRRRGIRVPQLAPPAYRPWRGHRLVEVSEGELEPVIQILTEQHPPGSEWRWGFNTNQGGRPSAWVVSEEGIDLEAIVAEVRQRESH